MRDKAVGVENFRIRPQARQFAKKLNRAARIHKMLQAKSAQMSQEAMMLQELTGEQGNVVNRLLQQAPKDLVHELEDQSLSGEM
jgi:hypothetical protein